MPLNSTLESPPAEVLTTPALIPPAPIWLEARGVKAASAAELQLKVQACTVSDVQDHIFLLRGLESGTLGFNRVVPDGKIRGHVLAGFVGLDRARQTGFDIGNGDLHVGNHRSCWISDRADDAGVLGQRKKRQTPEQSAKN
jgi:hypothetical protein